MSNEPNQPAKPSALRRRAEAQFKAHKPSLKAAAVPQRLQHELEVHQIELQMQNQEVQEARAKLEAALAQYTELYDFAPASYLSLQPDGLITRANLAAASLLGVERSRLLNRRFAIFVATADRQAFAALLTRAFETKSSETAELALAVEGKPPVTVQLRAGVTADGQECRLILADITKLKQAEAQLREQGTLLANVIEGTRAGTWHWNVPTGEVAVNAHWAEIVGYTLAELAPITIQTWLTLVHPEDLKLSEAALAAHFNRTLDFYDGEYRMRHRNGSWVWVHDRGKVVEWTPDGKPLVMAGSHVDITARKQTEHQLGERVKELRAFFRLAKITEREHLTLDEFYQELAGLLPASWQYPEVTCARVRMGGREFCTSNFEPSPWMQSQPIKVQGAVVGCVEVGYLEERPAEAIGPFLEEEQQLLETMATQIEILTERKQGEAALRESDDRLKFLLRNTPAVLYSLNPSAGMATTFISQNVEKMLGYPPTDFLQTPNFWCSHMHPDDAVAAHGNIQQLHATGELNREYRFRHADGSYHWMRDEMRLLRDEHSPAETIVGCWLDVTQQHEATAALQLDAAVMRKMADGVQLTRASDGVIIQVNSQFEQMFGYGPGEMVGRHVSSLNAPTDKDPIQMAEHIVAVVKECGKWQGEILNLKKDGTPFWSFASVSIFTHPTLGDLWVSVHQNITERKRAEDQLRQSEERFRNLFQKHTAVKLVVDPKTGFIGNANEAAASFYGWSVAQLRQMRIQEINVLPPEDLAQELTKATSSQQHQFEFRHRRADGSIRDVEVLSTPIGTSENVVLYSIVHDITERKQAEVALLQSQDRLSLAARAGGVGIWDLDLVNNQLVWDDQMFALYGIRRDQFGGAYEAWAAAVHPEELPRVSQEVQGALRGEKDYDTEFRAVWPDGTIRNIRGLAQVQRDASGRVVRMIGTNWDITAQKIAEAKLLRSEWLLRESQERAQIGSYVFHLATGLWEGSATLDKLFGIGPDFVRDTDGWGSLLHPEDRERTVNYFRHTIAHKSPFRMDYRIICLTDGRSRWMAGDGGFEYDASGQAVRFLGCIQDITERKQAEMALRESQTRFQQVAELLGEWVWEIDADGLYTYSSPVGEKVHGHRSEELVGKLHFYDLFPAERRAEMKQAALGFIAGKLPFVGFKNHCLHKDGHVVLLETSGTPLLDGEGNLLGYRGVDSDITKRTQAEQALEAQRQFLSDLMENNSFLIYVKDRDGRYQTVNRAFEEVSQRKREAILGRTDREIFPGSGNESFRPNDLAVMASGTSQTFEETLTSTEGKSRNFISTKFPVRDVAGAITGICGMTFDITERIEAEALARQLAAIVESSEDAIIGKDRDGIVQTWNRGAERMFGYAAREMIGGPIQKLLLSDRPSEEGSLLRHYETIWQTKDARPIHLSIAISPIKDRAGKVVGSSTVARDITERKRIEEANARLATAVEQACESIVVTDTQGIVLYVNPAFEKSSGYTRAEVLGQNPRVLKSGKQDAQFYREMWKCLERGEAWRGHFINQRKDGKLFEEDATISPVRDDQGRIVSYVAVKRDVTHERELEAQFRQAQKLEAIGQLAGGIAHDFNNILAAILGNAHFAIPDTAPSHPARECLEEIVKAGDRAKDLVQQILTFSRQNPQARHVIALGPIIAEAAKFVQATIPSVVQISLGIAEDVPTVLADATQIHQVIFNLCTNAWHAFEDRPGCIRIQLQAVTLDAAAASRFAKLQPGRFACLSVSDTGTSMSAATLERIFDPFFTTKAPGKGTGLGLSVVRGIVESHEGAITVVSEPGCGTTFQVYLPAATATAGSETTRAGAIRQGGGQHLLFIDDEEPLVRLATRSLEKLGYRVTAFTGAAEAMQAFRADPNQFDIIITDLNLPGMSGLDLAREFLALRPDVPLVVCSGYVTEETKAEARAVGIRQVFSKPVNLHELSATLRHLLTEPPQP